MFESIQNFMYITEMQKKIQKIFFHFEIIAFELIALAFTERIYLLSGVTILTKSLTISDTSKNELMGLIFFEFHQTISKRHCCADLSSVSKSLTC